MDVLYLIYSTNVTGPLKGSGGDIYWNRFVGGNGVHTKININYEGRGNVKVRRVVQINPEFRVFPTNSYT